MIIDTLFSGVPIAEVKPREKYEDGKPLGVQDSVDSIPLWTVTTALKDGIFTLPVKVKVASKSEPEIGRFAIFSGVEITAFKGNVYFSAKELSYVEEIDMLDNIFDEEE